MEFAIKYEGSVLQFNAREIPWGWRDEDDTDCNFYLFFYFDISPRWNSFLDFFLFFPPLSLTWFKLEHGCLMMTRLTIVFQIRKCLFPWAVRTSRTGSDRSVTSCSAYSVPSGRTLNLGSLLSKVICSSRWQDSNFTKQKKQHTEIFIWECM